MALEPTIPGLPRVLADPPWRRRAGGRREASEASRASTALPAPMLVWQEGEREELAGPSVRRLAGEADERLFDRLLERADEGRPLPASELDRLSDERLAELAEEVPPSAIDFAGMRRMLARLGDPFVARAVSVVRARTVDGDLFAAMGPVRAAELAPLAAARFFNETTSGDEESHAERWLVRHAEVAAAALVSLVHDDDAARAALAWIALRTGDAGPGARHAEAAIAGSVSLDVARLVARGDAAAAIARLSAPSAARWVAGALAGDARAEAIAWLEARRDAVRAILEACAGEDEAARTALEVLGGDAFAGDPALDEVPAAIPPLPAFVDLAALPRATLAGGTPLPDDAMTALLEMLRFSPLTRPYAGLVQARAACDPAGLDAVAVALLEAWIAAGSEPIDRWALDACGKIGGDGAAREVTKRVRSWALGATPPRSAWDDEERRIVLLSEGDRAWAYARAGLAVLSAIGTDLALTSLDDLARHGGASWARREGRAQLEEARRGRQVRRAQLEDAIVPDLSLEDDGTALLDLGPRRYRVTFDEVLAPVVLDESGVRVASFPRARKTDDASKYAAAKARHAGLVRDTKVLARQQLGALEQAMCARRAWSLDAFRARFVEHPLLRHLGRRLVWGVLEGEGLGATFRVAEDLTLADADDAELALAPDAKVVVAHPIELEPDRLARWRALFGDYQIVQPFAQLARELTRASEVDPHATEIVSARGAGTSRGRLFGLARRGWEARAEDGVLVRWERELPASGYVASVTVEPGLVIGEGGEDEQSITRAWCTMALGELPAIDRSELMRDVLWLARDPHR